MIGRLRLTGYGLYGRAQETYRALTSLNLFNKYRDRIVSEGIFDVKFYTTHSLDVVEAGVDPLLHYLQYGHAEGRWPNPRFDTDFYRTEHLNGDQRVIPIIHYLLEGRERGLPTSRSYPSVQLGDDDFHMPPQSIGVADNHIGDFYAFCTATGIFDETYYLESNRDLFDAKVDLFEHFMTFGWKEGRNPSRIFSLEWYRSTHLNNDDTINPLEHFYKIGVYRGLSTMHGFSEAAEIGKLRKLSQLGRFVYPESPEVTIAIINFNGAAHLADLIASLSDLDYPAYRVLLVDNGSSDDSVAWMRANAPFADIVEVPENIGFADAANLALDIAPTQLVAFLNNDMAVDQHWLRGLVDALKDSPQRGAATSKMLFFKPFVTITVSSDREFLLSPAALLKNHEYKKFFVEHGREHRDYIRSGADNSVSIKVPLELGRTVEVHPQINEGSIPQSFPGRVVIHVNGLRFAESQGGAELFFDSSVFAHAGKWVVNNAGSHETTEDVVGDRGFGEYDVGQYDFEENVPYLCGGSFIINRTALRGRPVFLGDLFAYFEDTEMSVRLRQDGYSIGYAPKSVAFHKHASTSQEKSIFFQRHVERNYSAFFARKRGLSMIGPQISHKKAQLNHLKNFFAENPNSTEREKTLSEVYPEMIRQLDDLQNALMHGREFCGSHRALRVGIYNSYWSTAGGGELHALNVANYLSRFCVIDLISESDFDLDKLLERFQLPRDRFRKVLIHPISSADTEAYDVFVNSTVASNLVSRAPHSFFIVSFPHQQVPEEMLESYTFLPNSAYTNHWCREFWGERSTKLLYPLVRRVVETPDFIHKRKIILNVGRFFPDGHCKMQHEVVETFKQLVAHRPEYKDWRLVCAGGLDYSRDDCIAYYDNVAEIAKGANVDLLPDASFEELNDLYRSAAIYWHATGFGKDVTTHPYDFEHFGISTVEAMSAGCIPVVINVGGQPEIVHDDAFGSCFDTRAQWIDRTLMWMSRFESDSTRFEAAMNAAAAKAGKYQSAGFERSMKAIFAEVEQTDAELHHRRSASEFTMDGYWRFRLPA